MFNFRYVFQGRPKTEVLKKVGWIQVIFVLKFKKSRTSYLGRSKIAEKGQAFIFFGWADL